jgi:hypothetical protein
LGTEEKRGTTFRSSTVEIFETLAWNYKLDKEKNQCIKEKTGAENIVKEIKQYRKSGYNTYRGWTETEYQNKYCNIDQQDEGT